MFEKIKQRVIETLGGKLPKKRLGFVYKQINDRVYIVAGEGYDELYQARLGLRKEYVMLPNGRRGYVYKRK